MKRIKWLVIIGAMIAVVVLGWRLLELSTSQETSSNSERIAVARRSATSAPSDLLRPLSPGTPPSVGVTESSPPDAGPGLDDEPIDDETTQDGGLALMQFMMMLAKNAEQATRNVDRFCELSRRVSKVKAFAPPPPTGNRDAALYLSSRIDWEGGIIGSLHLPKSLTDRMGSPPQHWVDMTPADYAGLDFGWMSDLLEFDTWSMSTTGPLRDLKDTNYLEAPIPNFISLQQWAKLRLVKGAREGDLARASVEVRHLADLCASTQILIGEMIRSAMYGTERTFYERRGLAPPASLPSTEDTQTYRRTTWSGMLFLMPGVPKSVREQAIACTASRCTAINEALGMSAAARDALPEAKANLNWLLAQSPCDPTLAGRIASSPSITDEALQKQFDGMPDIDSMLSYDAGTP